MAHNNKEVLEYWNKDEVESMYDKFLMNLETEMIRKRIKPGSKILDAGCGEGEGTIAYSSIPETHIHAVDFSDTRLKKAKERLADRTNVVLKKVDFLTEYQLDDDYDYIISQRFLINLMEWNLQKKVILDLLQMLKPSGTLLMFEGCMDGVDELNAFRALYKLKPIEVKWHNLFFKNEKLIDFMQKNGYELIEEDGLGEYFLLTRGLRPIFNETPNWDHEFNEISSGQEIKQKLEFRDRFSRLKFWAFSKKQM